MIKPLLACVQRPEEVQLVLPVRTCCGFPLESQNTTNLLWAKCEPVTIRSINVTLDFSAARTLAFSSLVGGLNAPLARIRLQFFPNASRAGIRSEERRVGKECRSW